MAISKVTLNRQTLMDVTKDTVNASNTLKGYKGHKNDGTQFTGEFNGSGYVYQDNEGYIVLSDEGSDDDTEQFKDVNFIGKNGEILYSYTAQEFLQLEDLPPLPSYSGFISQEWNWTIVDAKNNVNEMGVCDIGVIVRPSDGKTHIYVDITDTVNPYIFRINQRIGNNAIVDWGDGSPTERKPTTNNCDFSHNYSEPGEYDISIEVIENISNFYAYYTYNNSGAWHKDAIKRVNIGTGLTSVSSRCVSYCQNLTEFTMSKDVTSIATNMFEFCPNLETLIIPRGVTGVSNYLCNGCISLKNYSIPVEVKSIGTESFRRCLALKRAVIHHGITTLNNYAFSDDGLIENVFIPDTITSLGTYVFNNNCSLLNVPIPSGISSIPSYYATSLYRVQSLIIPEGVTTISANAFQYSSMLSVTLPSTITSIAAYVFTNCASLREVHIHATTPPTLSNTNAIPTTIDTLFVPYSSDHSILFAYQATTNWSTYASKMLEEQI